METIYIFNLLAFAIFFLSCCTHVTECLIICPKSISLFPDLLRVGLNASVNIKCYMMSVT